MKNINLKNLLKLTTLAVATMTTLACFDNGNLGAECTSDGDCTDGNACTVITSIHDCDGKSAEDCYSDIVEQGAIGNFNIYRNVGKCTVVQPRSECDWMDVPCAEHELCVDTGGFSNFACQAKYEQRIDGFPCHEDSVCASGLCTIITDAPGYSVGICETDMMTSNE